jgi:hypothetical protein
MRVLLKASFQPYCFNEEFCHYFRNKYGTYPEMEPRDSDRLIKEVFQFGVLKASPSGLKVVEIPDDIAYSIESNSDGEEYISEIRRTWF